MTLPNSSPVIDSAMAKWDARWKLAGLFSFALSSVIAQSIPATALAFAFAGVLVVCARLPIRAILTVASVILMGVVPLAVAIPLLGTNGMGDGIALVFR